MSFEQQHETYEYDDAGRMKYHPDFHANNGKRWSEYDKWYLCKFYETDGIKKISLALERTEGTVTQQYMTLQRKGEVEKYKNMTWEG